MAAYQKARAVPDDHVVTLDVSQGPAVTRAVYQQQVERPIVEWLRTRAAFDRIACIVLGPGLPLAVEGTSGRNGTTASVDSELSALYRRLTGATVPLVGSVDNPFFAPGSLATPRPFTRSQYDIYLVTRLDGSTEADARALLDRGMAAPAQFTVVIDGRPPAVSGVEARWLEEVPARVQAARPDARVVSDASADVVQGVTDVTGYAGWGSNDFASRHPPVAFGVGALATSFMSSDARTMAVPANEWVPASWEQPERFFAGSPEALAADWLRAGLTGLGAQVSEPYLDGAFRPATLLEAWARGYTLAESYYLALPYLSWKAVVFGDPLARTAEGAPLATEAPASGAPVTFTDRSAAALRQRQPDLDLQTARLIVRANLSIATGEHDAARTLLEEATVRAPHVTAAQIMLAQEYERAGLHDLARARYRAVLQVTPAHPVALNNLAYSLAVRAGKAAEALPLAERAAVLGSNSPPVLDTLGWVRHLAGDSRGALEPLREATRRQATLCEAWLHLAVVERSAGTLEAARAAAARAIACDATLASSDSLRDLKD